MKSRKYNLEAVMLDSSQIIGCIAQAEIKQGEPILTTSSIRKAPARSFPIS